MRGISRRGLVGAALLLALAPTAALAQSGEPVKIGVVLSLSGPAAVFGLPERNAIMALDKEIQAAGGVKGRKLELVFFDDKTNPTEAARGVTQLINDEKVVVGATLSTEIVVVYAAGDGQRLALL